MADDIVNGGSGGVSGTYTLDNSGSLAIGITGLGGGLGQTNLGVATITHYDPTVGHVVQDKVIIGGDWGFR